MDDATLIRMANQISSSLAGYPHDEAVRETAYHINAFWEARMRNQFLALPSALHTELDPVARAAMCSIKPGPATRQA